jgi:hypothetical protein
LKEKKNQDLIYFYSLLYRVDPKNIALWLNRADKKQINKVYESGLRLFSELLNEKNTGFADALAEDILTTEPNFRYLKHKLTGYYLTEIREGSSGARRDIDNLPLIETAIRLFSADRLKKITEKIKSSMKVQGQRINQFNVIFSNPDIESWLTGIIKGDDSNMMVLSLTEDELFHLLVSSGLECWSCHPGFFLNFINDDNGIIANFPNAIKDGSEQKKYYLKIDDNMFIPVELSLLGGDIKFTSGNYPLGRISERKVKILKDRIRKRNV